MLWRPRRALAASPPLMSGTVSSASLLLGLGANTGPLLLLRWGGCAPMLMGGTRPWSTATEGRVRCTTCESFLYHLKVSPLQYKTKACQSASISPEVR